MNTYYNLQKPDVNITVFGCLYYRFIRLFRYLLCLNHYTISEFEDTTLFFNILELVDNFNRKYDKSKTHIVSKLINNQNKVQPGEYLIPNDDFIITIDNTYKFYLRYEVNRLQIYTKHIEPLYNYFNLHSNLVI